MGMPMSTGQGRERPCMENRGLEWAFTVPSNPALMPGRKGEGP
jgi:hypothetical protein